jgi:hypothetical protein
MLPEEMNTRGDRGLIAAILIKAIEDGKTARRPRPQYLAVAAHKKYKKKFEMLCEETFDIINLNSISTNFKFKLLLKYLRIVIKIKKRVDNYANELLAHEARSFFSAKNKLYVFYCTLIDIEPVYLEEKVFKFFKDFDQGLIR